MGEYREYVCDSCGWKHIDENDIFIIGKDHKVDVAPLLFSTSKMMRNTPASGYYREYYCYNCQKTVKKFIINNIWDNMYGFNDEIIVRDIEDFDDSLKIIEFDESIQRCLECNRLLTLRPTREKIFILTEDGDFKIPDKPAILFFRVLKNINYKFAGKYHGYFCPHCRKQINKFIILENPADLSENEIKDILNEHTFDLTIYLDRTSNECPDCGKELEQLGESSKCPKCRKGRLKLENYILMD